MPLRGDVKSPLPCGDVKSPLQTSHWRLAPLAVLLVLVGLWASCGGGGSNDVIHVPGTPAGTYSLTVTGTTGSGSATLQHNFSLTLTVR